MGKIPGVLKTVRGLLEFPSFWQADVERLVYAFLNVSSFYRLGGYLILGRNPSHEFILFRFRMPLLPLCELDLKYLCIFLSFLLLMEWGWLLKKTRDDRVMPHLTRCPAFYAVAAARFFFMLFVTIPQG